VLLKLLALAFGFGLSIVFFFARYAFPKMPKWISLPGMGFGFLLMIGAGVSWLMPNRNPLAAESFPGFSNTIGFEGI
jgi:hypothetical protein